MSADNAICYREISGAWYVMHVGCSQDYRDIDYLERGQKCDSLSECLCAAHEMSQSIGGTEYGIYEDVAIVDEKDCRIASLEAEVERLKADCEKLNQMVRDTGQGQGAIDSYVAQCEDIDALRSRDAMIRKMIQERIGKCDRRSDDAWLRAMLNRMDVVFPLQLTYEEAKDAQ